VAWIVEAAGTGKRAAAAASPARRWLIWAPVAFGLGAQAFFLAPATPPAGAAALAALGAVALGAAALWLRGLGAVRPVAAALALAGACTGFAAADWRAARVAAPVLAGETEALVEGRIAAITQSASGRPRLLLERVRIWGLDAALTPARVRVTLARRADGAGLAPGAGVSVMARLGPPGGPVSPGAFDFARAAWFERLGGIGVARGRVARIDPPPPQGAWERARLARDALRARLAEGLRAALPGRAGAFAAAVAAGDRAGLPPDDLQALRDSGLAHLLAISGLHMAMVCGLVFGGLRLALAATPGVGARARSKAWAAAAGLVAGALYLLLSGASIATQRAFAMAAVALAAVIADRPALTLRALAAAALAVLALAPESLTQVGFQMSFAATLALVAGFEAARRRGWLDPARDWRGRALRWVALLAASSLIAGAATAPFAAFHFNRVAHFGLLANLLALPAMGLAVAPGLLAAAALAPLGLEAAPLRLAEAGVGWILTVASWVAGLPGAASTVASPAPAALWSVVAGGLTLCLVPGRAALAGLAPLAVAAGLWVAAPAARPDILIAPGGAAVGARQADGALAVSHGRAGAFAAQVWARRDGGAATGPFAEARAWRLADAPQGWRVAVYLGERLSPRVLRDRCGPRRLLLLPRAAAPGPASVGCVVLDRAALADGRARAAWVRGEALRWRVAADGRRWSR